MAGQRVRIHTDSAQRGDGEHPEKREAISEEADGSAADLGGDQRLREHASAATAGR